MFMNSDALNLFAYGAKVRTGSQFKAVDFFGDGTILQAIGCVVVNDAVFTIAHQVAPGQANPS